MFCKISKPRVGDKFTFGLPSGEVSVSGIEIVVRGEPAEGQQQYSSQMIWGITPQSGWTEVQGPTARLMRSSLYWSNSDFGDHTISVSYEDSSLITHTGSVTVKVFFKKYDETNPGNVDPNWYYYWSQTSATTGSHYYGGDNGNVDGEYFSGDNFFYIYDHASETSEVGGGYRSNRPAGIEVSGIDLFAVVCLHENLHQTHYFDWVATGLADSDGDWVPDAIEDSNGNGVWDWTDLNGDGTYNDGEGETRIDINDRMLTGKMMSKN